MKNYFKLVPVFLTMVLLNSCAKDISFDYQTDNTNTGVLILKPVSSTERTFVTINGKLIVDNGSVKSVTIRNLPKGDYVVRYASESSWYKEKLDVSKSIKMKENEEFTQLIEVPPLSNGYWFYVSAMGILPWFLFLLI